jgi:hypothetical protein
MKKTIRQLAIIALLLGAFSSTAIHADTFPQPPSCPPGGCQAN